MGNTYCKQCKIGCIDKEEVKRELCHSYVVIIASYTAISLYAYDHRSIHFLDVMTKENTETANM